MHETFDQRYAKLNDEQRKAVDVVDGPVLVIAGPGSGKTELLSLRVANILRQTDLPASSILCLTFTDAAAVNMQRRLAGLIGTEAYKVAIHTFHSFGTEIINRYGEYFYQGVRYQALDDLTRLEILEEILKDLSHENPLNSFSEDHGYTYLEDIKNRIGELKKAGLTAEEFEKIIESNVSYLREANSIVEQFFSINSLRSVKVLAAVPSLISQLKGVEASEGDGFGIYSTLGKTVVESLEAAFSAAVEVNKTKPITEWKNEYLEKDSKNNFVFKTFKDTRKHYALGKIYGEYQKQLRQRGYFDYEDMILDVAKAMEKHPDLKFSLQEHYQYVLVDEFQDTNGAQMRLLDLLLDADVNEGRPNILAVGDDDQAIYKFQGAKLDNIIQFNGHYREPAIVVLTRNYRSTQPVLNLVRSIILKGVERLENKLDNVTKELVAANESVAEGEIVEKGFDTQFHEFIWVAEEIKRRMESGEELREIAVIAPRHRLLEEMAKYLDYMGVAISYERKRNLFEQRHIMELINMLRFVNSLNRSGQKEADELLPEILSYQFFDVSRIEIWKISVEAYSAIDFKNQKLWLEVMLGNEDEKIRDIANFFIALAGFAKQWTGEEIIDILAGVKSIKISEDREFCSPYKEYYFGKEEFVEKRDKYMDHLTALQAFVKAVRAFRGGTETLMVEDLVEFVDLHQRHKLGITYETAFNNSEDAVQLMTVYKSKGLEFETVYALSCVDNIWSSGGARTNLKFPPNIPLSPAEDNSDDYLRLFYVTLSRAKRNIFITHHQYKDDGKGLNKLRFLEDGEVACNMKGVYLEREEIRESQIKFAEQKSLRDFYEMKFNPIKYAHHSDGENGLLKKILEGYQLSVTHLNNFLDIQNAGPKVFLENNLLRFPQRQTASLAYGNAVHKTIEILHREFKKKGFLPTTEDLLLVFEEVLRAQRLNKHDFGKMLKKGQDHLPVYYQKRRESFNSGDLVERSFRQQNVVVNGARITGKLDKIKFVGEKEMSVFDLKTGKPFQKWDNSRKSRNYKDQLVFYKLLIENSRDYSKYAVNEGVIEFFQPEEGEIILLSHFIALEEVEEMGKLVEIVFGKIMALDFPDVSRYADPSGEVSDFEVMEFRQDLLEGRV